MPNCKSPANAPWAIFADRNRWPLSQNRTFTAEAVQLIGSQLCDPWQADDPEMLAYGQLPEIPAAYSAFDDAGPIASVHDAFADSVRLVKSPATFAAEQLSEEEWLRSFVQDPDGGEPIPSLLLRARRGEDRADPVTYDHWEEACIEAASINEPFPSRMAKLTFIGKTMQSLVLAGSVKSYLRPIGGSVTDLEEVRTAWWELDDPLPRLACCGLNIDRPMDSSAPPTHWLFVDEKGELQRQISKIERQSFWDPPLPEPRRHRYSEATVERVQLALVRAFEDDRPNMTKADYRRLVSGGTRIPEASWRAAWREATVAYPVKCRPGRPRKLHKS